MAKFTPILGELHGRLGGLVFQGSGTKAIVRTLAIPVVRETEAQSLRRSGFGGNARRWGGEVTPVQRAGWDDLSTEPETGYQLFMGINTTRTVVLDPALTEPPDNLFVTPDTDIEVQEVFENSTTIPVIMSPQLGVAERMYVEFTPVIPQTRSNFLEDFRFAGVSTLGQVSPIDFSLPSWLFPLVQAKKIGVRVYRYNSVNGVLGVPFLTEREIEPPE